MRKIISSILLAASFTPIFGAGTQPAQKNESTQDNGPILLSAKDASTLALTALEKGYIQRKAECDDAISYAGEKIRQASAIYKFYTPLNFSPKYSYGKIIVGLDDYGHYHTACEIEVIRYLIAKKGFTVQTGPEREENKIIVSW